MEALEVTRSTVQSCLKRTSSLPQRKLVHVVHLCQPGCAFSGLPTEEPSGSRSSTISSTPKATPTWTVPVSHARKAPTRAGTCSAEAQLALDKPLVRFQAFAHYRPAWQRTIPVSLASTGGTELLRCRTSAALPHHRHIGPCCLPPTNKRAANVPPGLLSQQAKGLIALALDKRHGHGLSAPWCTR